MPVPSRLRRFILLTLISGALIFGPWKLIEKVVFLPVVVLVCGTYRRFRIGPGTIKQRWTVGFFDLPPKTFKLKRYSRIEVKYTQQTSQAELATFGIFALAYGWLLNKFFPWLGGTYQIWLTRGEQQVLAWQGNSQTDYEQNLETLKSASGMDVVVR